MLIYLYILERKRSYHSDQSTQPMFLGSPVQARLLCKQVSHLWGTTEPEPANTRQNRTAENTVIDET